MADIKAIRYETVVSLTHDEFSLIFKAVGKSVGAKVKLTAAEVVALRELNAKLARLREQQAFQMHEAAYAAKTRAELLLGEPVPEDTEKEGQ